MSQLLSETTEGITNQKASLPGRSRQTSNSKNPANIKQTGIVTRRFPKQESREIFSGFVRIVNELFPVGENRPSADTQECPTKNAPLGIALIHASGRGGVNHSLLNRKRVVAAARSLPLGNIKFFSRTCRGAPRYFRNVSGSLGLHTAGACVTCRK